MLIKQDDDVNLLIVAFSSLGVHETRAIFDLSAGTAGTAGDTGDFSGGASSIVDLGDGWYLCRLGYTTDDADGLDVRYQLLTAANSTTMAGGEGFFAGVPVTMLQTATTDLSEYPLTVHAGTGPMFQVRLAFGTITQEVVSGRSDWKHCASRNRLRGFDRFGFYHLYDELRAEDRIRIELWDPDNANGYIEAGRVVVGRALSLKGVATAHGLDETGGQIEMDGGQIYRTQGVVRRRLDLTLRYIGATREEARALAYDELHLLRRVHGRSRQVLVIADETDPLYLQEGMVYGYIDELPPMPVSGRDGRFELPISILETP
jgi:hypothetical protein